MNLFRNQTRHVLYAYQDDLIVVTCQGNKPISVDEYDVAFGASDEQTQEVQQRFSEFVRKHRADEFAILVDSVDETHVIDQIPRLVYRDRIALVKKRLSQRFRGVEYASYRVISAGQSKWNPSIKIKESDDEAKPTNGEVFLTALTDSASIDFWISALIEYRVKVVQLTSPSLLSTELIKGFASNGSGLLVSMHPAGLRQTLIINGVVQFSRLGKLSDTEPRGLEREIVQTLQYLQSSQRIPVNFYKGDRLSVWLITTGLNESFKFSGELAIDASWTVPLSLVPSNAVITNPTPVPKFPGLGPWIANVGRGKGFSEYTTKKLHYYARRVQHRRRLWFAGLGVAAAGVVLTLAMPFVIQHSLPDATRLAQTERAYMPTLRALQSQLSQYKMRSTAMKAVVRRAQAHKARHISTRDIFEIAANGLKGDTQIVMEKLQWQRIQVAANQVGVGSQADDGGAAAAMADANFGAPDSTMPGRLTSPSVSYVGPASTAIEPPPPIEITLSGQLNAVKSKTSANQRVRQIATRIESSCNCQVTRLELPYDPSPAVALTENFEKAGRTKDRFTIVARWIDDVTVPSLVVKR